MAARYFPIYPSNVPVDDSIKAFIFNFYGTSDTRGATESWVDYFTDDATVVMGNDLATGKEGEFYPASERYRISFVSMRMRKRAPAPACSVDYLGRLSLC